MVVLIITLIILNLIFLPFYYFINLFKIVYYLIKRKKQSSLKIILLWICLGIFILLKNICEDTYKLISYLMMGKSRKNIEEKLSKKISNKNYAMIGKIFIQMYKDGFREC